MSDNDKKITVKIDGLGFTCEEPPYIVLSPPLQSEEEARKLWVRISDNAKEHSYMSYTASIDTMELIFKNMTLRSSSLTYAHLNDKMEKQRVGISQFAGGRYITCFSHNEHESIPFWAYYGGNIKENKVQLRFRNFADRLQECINTDYAFLNNCTGKIFFYSEEYTKTLNANATFAQMLGSKPINEDYDIRNCIREINVFDVKYIPYDSENITHDFSDVTNMSTGREGDESTIPLRTYRPDILEREKTDPWEYECETRIMCVLDYQEVSFWDYIDLRLKDEMFRGLTIIMNPWADETLEGRIGEIINGSELPQDIKESISIEHSVVDGTVDLQV